MAVTNDLVTDQRVHRSCTALHEAGYEVTLVGRLLPSSAPVSRQYRTVRMRLLFRRSAAFYAEYNVRLFFRMLFARADGFYANDTDTLPAAFLAARIRRKPLFFDAHELFPEVPELADRPRIKRFWERIEEMFLPPMSHRKDMAAATVCQSIADIYRRRYGLQMAVVRNVPMDDDSHPSDGASLPTGLPRGKHILLYQGAVNVGRGLEPVIDAMPMLRDCHLLVAGVGDRYDALRARAAGCDNITFLGRLEPSLLHTLTRQAHLGLSLLENRGLNYYYSLPNRIADFAKARVPVLATDFPEIRRVVAGYGIGTLVDAAIPPGDLAGVIRSTLQHWSSMPTDEKERVFARAAADLNWENDKKTLLNAVGTIFKQNRRYK